jgi:trimeric autotransporter adhesin
MTTAYSTNLELALPVQGELSGTWGDTVNNGITQYLDAAIAGSQIISGSQTAVTLTNTNGDASATNIAQAGSGATGTAQYQIIRCTGNPAGLLTVTISDTGVAGYSKTFVIINATSTSQSVKIVGSGPTTGITVASGDKALVAWNGSDFVRVGASAGGSNTQVQYNSSGNLAGSSNLTFDGTTLTAAGFSGPLNGTVGATTPSTVVATQVNVTAQGDVRFEDTTGGQYVALQAPGTVSTNVTFTLPGADGTNGQAIVTNGSGVLSFAAAGVSQAKVTAIAMVFGF